MRAGLDLESELELDELLQTGPLRLGAFAQLLAFLRVAHEWVRVREQQCLRVRLRRGRTHLCVVLDSVSDEHAPVHQLGDLLLHLLKRRGVGDVALPHARDPRAPVGHLLARLHKRVVHNVSVVVYERDACECALRAHVAQAHHFAIDREAAVSEAPWVCYTLVADPVLSAGEYP